MSVLTFKSYSESFNASVCEEFYGHFTNYKKINKLKSKQANLYAIVHHYPKKFLSPYEGTRFLKTIKEDEIFDIELGTLKKIRMIITRTTDNPLLELFSGDVGKMFNGYNKLQNETSILDEISGYISQIKTFYGTEARTMYTKEDFFREFPKTDKPFFYPWEEKYIEKLVEKTRQEAEEKTRLAEQKARQEAEQKARLAEEKARLAEEKAKLAEEKARLEQRLRELESKIDFSR
jgi:hypothetical protein